MNNYFTSVRYDISKYIPKNVRRVLEIGCGDANFVKFLPTCEYWGVEPNIKVKQIKSLNIFKIYKCDYENAYDQMPDNYFDLIIVNDVVEHMTDHDYFLETIKKKMTQDSYIIGSVPNVRHISNLINLIIHKDWQYQSSGILDKTHLRFFTTKSLIRSLNLHGYYIELVQPINRQLCKRLRFKCLIERVLCLLLGRDTEFNQLIFCVRKNRH